MEKEKLIVLGLIKSGQYNDANIGRDEIRRAKDLIEGLQEPATGFEIHFLKCWHETANPACPKEIQLLSAVSQSIMYDEAISESGGDYCSGADEPDEYGNTQEDYNREDEQRTRELVSELEERTRRRRGLKPLGSQTTWVPTRSQDDNSLKATQNASQSELIKSYQDWSNSCDEGPFVS